MSMGAVGRAHLSKGGVGRTHLRGGAHLLICWGGMEEAIYLLQGRNWEILTKRWEGPSVQEGGGTASLTAAGWGQ